MGWYSHFENLTAFESRGEQTKTHRGTEFVATSADAQEYLFRGERLTPPARGITHLYSSAQARAGEVSPAALTRTEPPRAAYQPKNEARI